MLQYHDTYLRVDGEWAFERRRFHRWYQVDALRTACTRRGDRARDRPDHHRPPARGVPHLGTLLGRGRGAAGLTMTIGRLYHVIHIVEDLDEAESFYGAVFPLEMYTTREWSDVDKRWASLSIIADNFVVELIEPSRAEEDQAASIPKFANRFGNRLHSMAWFSDDVPTLAERFQAAGIRVLGGGYGTIFTHPKDTFGQLQFQTGPPEIPVPDPRLVPGWSRSAASVDHPLGLVRCVARDDDGLRPRRGDEAVPRSARRPAPARGSQRRRAPRVRPRGHRHRRRPRATAPRRYRAARRPRTQWAAPPLVHVPRARPRRRRAVTSTTSACRCSTQVRRRC